MGKYFRKVGLESLKYKTELGREAFEKRFKILT